MREGEGLNKMDSFTTFLFFFLFHFLRFLRIFLRSLRNRRTVIIIPHINSTSLMSVSRSVSKNMRALLSTHEK